MNLLPKLSTACRIARLDGGSNFIWPNHGELHLKSIFDGCFDPPGNLGIIVIEGRMGLAHIINEGALHASNINWLQSSGAESLYIQYKNVRSMVESIIMI